MSLNRTPRRATARAQLVDAVMDAYVTWREQSAAVTATYEHWRCASPELRTTSYEAYADALDREERAASAYQRMLEAARTG
jgi:hypothetical protein